MTKKRAPKTECPACHVPTDQIVCPTCGCASRRDAPVESRKISPVHAATEVWVTLDAVHLPLGSARVCGHHKPAV